MEELETMINDEIDKCNLMIKAMSTVSLPETYRYMARLSMLQNFIDQINNYKNL